MVRGVKSKPTQSPVVGVTTAPVVGATAMVGAIPVVGVTAIRKRIRVKTKPKGRAGRKKGSKKKQPTARDHALSSGLVPKARNAYALFTQDELRKPEYVGKLWPQSSKTIALRWKALTQSELIGYQHRASQEKHIQHSALQNYGFRNASNAVVARVHPSPRPERPLPPEQVRYGKYTLCHESEIGRGSYGQVVIAKDHAERRVAIKIFSQGHEVKHEVAVLTHMGAHPCLLAVLDHHVEPPTPYMVTPFIPGGNVCQLLRLGTPDSYTQNGIVAQLAEAVTWMHSHKVAHLDVKPANMLWDPRCCTLFVVDFGMSLELKADGTPVDNIAPHCAVTPNYRPPELWTGLLTKHSQCKAVDVWSFGVAVTEVYGGGQLLFSGKQEERIHKAITEWSTSWINKRGNALLVNVPSDVRNVVWFCCSPDPTRRPPMCKDLAAWGQSLGPCPMTMRRR